MEPMRGWFQGVMYCGGVRMAGTAYDGGGSTCLWLHADEQGADLVRLAEIVARLFPSRTTCGPCEVSAITRLIHFNNAPETTREDVTKVLKTYTEEMETA